MKPPRAMLGWLRPYRAASCVLIIMVGCDDVSLGRLPSSSDGGGGGSTAATAPGGAGGAGGHGDGGQLPTLPPDRADCQPTVATLLSRGNGVYEVPQMGTGMAELFANEPDRVNVFAVGNGDRLVPFVADETLCAQPPAGGWTTHTVSPFQIVLCPQSGLNPAEQLIMAGPCLRFEK